MDSVKFQKMFGVEFSPKQERIFNSEARQLNLSGEPGTGKSFAVYCIIINKCISVQKTTVFFIAPSARQCKEKQRRILQLLSESGKGELVENSVNGVISFVTGSRVVFFSAEMKSGALKGWHSEFQKAKTATVITILDDCTYISREIAENVFSTLLTASHDRWTLLLTYNPTTADHWTFEHDTAGRKKNKAVVTFEFTSADSRQINKEVLAHLEKVSPGYTRRHSGWDASKYTAFPERVLAPCIDHSFGLGALKAEKEWSYALGVDCNDLMAESTGRDRDASVFMAIGKRISGDDIQYRVINYESYQKAVIGQWLDTVQRFNRLYRLEKYFIESPHSASLVEKMRQDQELKGEIVLCNPYHSNDRFSLKAGYIYLNQCLQNKWLHIPADAVDLLRELRAFKVDVNKNNELRYFHAPHHHNDHIASLAWCLIGMRDLQATGYPDLDDVYSSMKRSQSRPSFEAMYDSPINRYDREFLRLPSKREREFF